MIGLILSFQPHQDLHRLFLIRLLYINRLKPPLKRRVFLYMAPVLFQRRRANHLKSASGEDRFQYICRIHRLTGARAGSHDHM